MTFRCSVFALAVVAAGACASNALAADSPRVFLVRSTSSSASAKEAMNRMQGELTAEGFEVAIVDSPSGEDSGLPEGQDTNAVSIQLVVDADEQAAELRVIDHLTNKTVIRHATIETQDPSQVAQVLSVRAVELLRASLMELLIQSRSRPAVEAPPTANISRAATGALPHKRDSTWGLDAGSAGLVGFGGTAASRIGPAVLGLIRVRLLLGRTFQLRATAAGLGTTPKIQAPPAASSGSATVDQDLGLVELVATPWSDAVLSPVASLGAGPFHTSVDGSPSRGFTPMHGAGWTPALDAGVGLTLRLGESLDVSLEAQALLTLKHVVTSFAAPDGTVMDGAGISQPSVLGTLTIVGWL